MAEITAAIRYTVIYERSPTGYGAYIPDLPGLGVVARTLDETKQLIRESIRLHVKALQEHGDAPEPPLPPKRSTSASLHRLTHSFLRRDTQEDKKWLT